MKRRTAPLGLSVPVLANIIHAFLTVNRRARDLLKDSLAVRERQRDTPDAQWMQRKHRKVGGEAS